MRLTDRKIVTEYVCPPIPVRGFDWRAVYADYEPGDPVGAGATEAEAMAELVLIATDRAERLCALRDCTRPGKLTRGGVWFCRMHDDALTRSMA